MKKFLLTMLFVTITTFQVTSSIDFYDILPPLPSWLPDTNPCNVTNCGNGICVATKQYPFVKCECKPGWKQPELYHDVPFQPCVVPNCTMDYTCSDVCHLSPAEAPLPALPKISNPFDPCSYGVCGAGICTRKSNNTVEYQCNCFKGYGNIMNWTWGFCSKECELQQDCSRLNITVSSNDAKVTSATNTSCVNGLLPPLPSWSPDTNLCNVTNCGNGTCVTTEKYPFVKCQCNPGWKQPELYHDVPFQPCVVPNYTNLCNVTNCGNGICVTTNTYPFVKCQCNPGWKQPELYHDVPFQPCVVPNCTIDYTCSGASAPSPAEAPLPALPKISELLNPCSYNVCGAGTCTLKSNVTLEYQCNCFKGYGNIMNWTWGFCSKECELQKDCSHLNVSVNSNDSTTRSSSTNDAQGGLKFMKKSIHLVTGSIMATLIMLLVK